VSSSSTGPSSRSYALSTLHVVGWQFGLVTSINVVALCQTQLVPRWVTICGRVNHIGMQPANKVDSASMRW